MDQVHLPLPPGPEPLPTRAAGLARLAHFLPRAGVTYAARRNEDLPGHPYVSGLSPWIRHRLVTEAEVIAAVRSHHPAGADTFLAEVWWRTYWKGWLELRPQIWADYANGVLAAQNRLAVEGGLRQVWQDACAGETGIDGFDHWARELAQTGWMHNHARMWFASIWIFTLGLPWRLGADFFYRHLIDGDAASNTLGWRWVAGLHTRGKPYPAEAQNIATFTAGRFTPRPSDLAEVTAGLESTEPDGLPTVQPLRAFTSPQAGHPTALLITDEDCRVEDFDLSALTIRTAATLAASHLRSPLPVSDLVAGFEAGALTDAATRAGVTVEAMQATDPAALAKWAARAEATQIATPYVTRGPLRDWLDAAAPALAKQGITLCEWRRDWDGAIWPHATAGFFKVKQNIPRILEQVGLE
ncbi:MAG: deoxyribodipyrimidine photolyase [Rhodobacteraceae bacterium PARR1]|nr:MAG: deoxyribodipyrimidine photolyase [Rhodobacteraceae bacterium PARR1]